MNLLKYFLVISNLIIYNSINAKESLNLFTEQYPPFNMIENGILYGISTDIMKELLHRENIKYKIELFPWSRAYKMALQEKNTAVFSTARTSEREHLFKWVGPLVENNWTFFAKKGSKISISHLEEAKNYIVGGYNADAVSEYLIKQNFVVGKNIQLATNERQNALKLEAGRIDLWATSSQLAPWIAKTEKLGQVVQLFTFKKVEMYAAFNKDTDDALINQLNKTLINMKKDGTFKKISSKYSN